MDQAFRLSPQQRRLWKLSGEGRPSSPYRVGCAVALAGELDPAALREALAAVVGRHEILRTAFRRLPDLEMPLQVVLPPGEIPLREVDLTGLDPAEQERRIGELLDAMTWEPDALAAGPPLRLTLAALAPARSVLVIGLPALCADRAGLRNLVREIAAAYGAAGTPDEPPVQYADLAEWLNGMLEREDTREERERWGCPGPADLHAVRLPFERPASGEGFSIRAVTVPVPEGGAWGPRLAARAAERETSVPVLLLAAWSALLARWTDSPEITVGTLFEGRSYEGLEEALGFLARVLPLGIRSEREEPFAVLLGRLDAAVRDAHERQEYFGWEEPDFLPFAFELEEEPPSHPAGAITFAPLPAHDLACLDRFRLKLWGRVTGDLVRLELQYDLDAFLQQDVERLAGQLAALLDSVLDTPDSPVGQLDLLPAAERSRLLELDVEAGPAVCGCVHHLFAEQARRAPDVTAVVCREDSLTYAELEERANRLAHALLRQGVSPGARVACCLPRGLEVLVGLLGILKAGAAFAPLDPQQPADRLALMLEDLGAPILLTTAELARTLPAAGARVLRLDADRAEIAAESAAPPEVVVSEAGLAYVIFTSGSTGRPKGVAVEHRQIFNYVAGVTARLELPAGASFATVSTFAADLGHTMIFPSLCTGGTLQVIGEEAFTDPEALTEAFTRRPVDCLKIVPSHLASLLAAASRPELLLPRLRLVLGGEACGPELIATLHRLAPPSCRIFNHYGPTETTVGVLTHPVLPEGDLAGSPPLGRPLPGTRVYVTDRHRQLAPFGMTGELWIGGSGIARGYLGRPDATAERFLPDPWGGTPGARLYRTGDLARRRTDGTVEFLGRCDDQVKLRGFRIEPGEITAQLLAHPAVAQAVVVLREEGGSEPRLVAYWVPVRGAEAEPGDLRSFLESRLPAVMVPASFVALAALPLTANGKLDRRALPSPERPYAAPGNSLEQTIAGIWQEVLGVERVGRDDNFFDVGGHSLLMIQVHARLRQRLGCSATVVELFQYPTVRALAGYLGATISKEEPRPATTGSAGAGGSIAIVGLAGRFPGAASVAELWESLRDGREAVVALTDEEIRAAGVLPERLAEPGYVKSGAVLADVDLFDAEFFGFSPREAEMLDPQHRLFLEASWQALEDAGYDPRGVPGRTGVWAGSGLNTYVFHLLTRSDLLQATGLWAVQHGNDKDFLPTRVSYLLNLRGPSLAVQTGCSTSLVAVHAACRSLAAGECDTALAGGVQVRAEQKTGYLYEEGGINSPDGHCRAFDAKARGTFSASGVGVVVLKRLEDALRDGDTIRAVIRGSAINNDGALKVGFTAPGVEGQAEVITAAHAAAGVSPETIGYVEAHGTGTPLGDPIEVAALTQAFRRAGTETERQGYCGLGTIKTNFGHLGAASGVAGLIKTVLILEHRQIPPSLHFETPNPAIDFAASPFRVVDRLTDWEANGGPLRAGVSSFGIGGTNAHAVLEEAPPAEPSGASRPLQLLLLSARTADALEEATARLAASLESHPEVPLSDVAHTLRRGRHPFDHRRMLVCASREDALAALRNRDPERLLSRRRESHPPPTAWLLPGQGSQHPGMGRDLYETEPVFRREIDVCAGILAPRLGRDLREILFSSPGAELAETRFAQPALFAFEHALARLWLSWGLRPRALLGHSLGEYVAACLAGVLSVEDALALVAARGELMQELPPGAMLSVDLSASEALAETAAASGLSLAAVNGPGQCVISGPVEEIDALAERLARRASPCRRLHTSHAFHSEMMEPILDRFAEIVSRVELRPPAIPYLSNLTGAWITADEARDPRYWVRHLRETVRFGDGVSRLLTELVPETVLLEVGPGRALGRLVRSQAAGRTVLASMPHPDSAESGTATLLHAVGRLWLAGAEIDWQAFQGEEKRRRVPLPTYPFQRRRHWVEPGHGALLGTASSVALLLPEGAAADPAWTAALESRGFRVIPVPSGQARPEALDELLDPRHRLAGETAPPDDPHVSGHARPGIDTPYEEPGTEIERRLAAIWGDLLGIDRVGIHDDFFELGGHSLLATRLLSRLRADFSREIQLEIIFEAPTVSRLAAHLAAGGESPALQASPILPVPRTGDLVLSFAQQRLLFLAVMAPGDPSYNLPLGLRLDGRLETRALRRALDALVARHEPLRTTFRIQESQVTQVIAPAGPLPLPLADLTELPADLREEEVRRLAREQARHPFDLLRGPVLTALLVRLAPANHLLLMTVHHIAADGWSCAVLYRDLGELYQAILEGRRPRLPELPVQYADFAAWQRGELQEEAIERHLDYWRTHLAGARAPALPTDRPRPLRPSGRGARLLMTLPAETVGAARRIARDEDATLFMVLLGAFAVTLHHASGCDDLVIGTDIANRNRRETEDLIGLFVNQLVLRNSVSGNPTFRELVRRVRRITLKAYAHQDAPFDRLVETLNPVRDLGTTPLFQVKLVLQNARMSIQELTELQVSPLIVHNQTAKFDLLLNLAETGETVSGVLEYGTDLWDEASMRSLLGNFATALAAGTARPDDRLSRIEEGLSRPSQQPGEERRTLRQRRAISVTEK